MNHSKVKERKNSKLTKTSKQPRSKQEWEMTNRVSFSPIIDHNRLRTFI